MNTKNVNHKKNKNPIIVFIGNEYLFSVCTKILIVLIVLGRSILVARYLGAGLQGINAYISSVVSVGAIVISCGIHQAYPYLRKEKGKNAIYEEYISSIFFLFLAFLLISVCIATISPCSAELKVSIILIPLFGYSKVVQYVSLIENPNKNNSWTIIIALIDLFLVMLLTRYVSRNFNMVVFILTFEEVLKCVVFSIRLRVVPKVQNVNLRFLREAAIFGFFPMLSLLMTTLNYKIDVLMLRAFPFITSAQIGVYSIGMNFADKIAIIPDTLKGVLISRLSKGADENEVAKVCRISFLVSAIIGISLLLFGRKIIDILYGAEYQGAYDVLIICMFGSVFVGYFKLIAQFNIINHMQFRNLLLLSISVLVNLVLNILLIPKYELQGAAFASGVGYFITGVVFVVWFAKSNGIKIDKMFLVQKEDFVFLKRLFKKST